MEKKEITSVDEYIADFPSDVQSILQTIRACIQAEAPQAIQTISYGIPTFKMNGKPLVYFAAYKNHIGFYATPNGHQQFKNELSKYKQGKGSVQFPMDEPMPLDLIKRIVRFRMDERQKEK